MVEFAHTIGGTNPENMLRKLVEGSPLDKLIEMSIDAAGWPAIFPNRATYHDKAIADYYVKSKAYAESDVTEEKTLDSKSLLSRAWK